MGGLRVEAENSKVYFAGDTGFAEGLYRRLHAKHGGLRLAILPIGAYAPRWFMQPHHQNPEEAADGMLLSGAGYAAGCHWGTFHLTNEPIAEPRERLGGGPCGATRARRPVPRTHARPSLGYPGDGAAPERERGSGRRALVIGSAFRHIGAKRNRILPLMRPAAPF